MVVSVDYSVFYVLICFLLIFWMARRTIFLPLDRILEERKEKIESAARLTESSEAEIKRKLKEFNDRINRARGEGFELRRGLKEEAAGREREVIEAARAAASEKVATAQAELEQVALEGRNTLAGESERLAASIAEALLRRQS